MKQKIHTKPGEIIQILDKNESKEFVSHWMTTYCKNKLGLNTKSYKWHIFCNKGYPSLEGQKALDAYFNQICSEYYIMDNDTEEVFMTDTRPTHCSISDYYVFPKNLAWTMAFTHEDGWIGPFFATHPNNEKLDIENQEKLEKQKQIEIAKQKGWC